MSPESIRVTCGRDYARGGRQKSSPLSGEKDIVSINSVHDGAIDAVH